MSLTQKEKILIAQQIQKEMPSIEFDGRNIKVRQFDVDTLINFIYDVHKRGEKLGYERAKKKLSKDLNKAIRGVLHN